MPFSSLHNPIDLARAQAALDDAWKQVKPMIEDGDRERERTRLSYIVASLVMLALDEEDLVDRALRQYRARQ
ncbi:hypothetical protein J2W99_005110 [Bosea robiniae]|jgi:hypothetical protein|uniref:hypothetical protein n=1 Tax=unclassified Bosea (in: a-proteobacteria) TaxID=2653178 RepID=UPI002858226E|nr:MULTISPECIES: hypothetical protein [unclassified Bosea (in: a-proteobacteria)]MDR6831357.1 hypothetical protein [Bosea robiniae]MDR6898076.1 hypothetical protein [Bosea sp. BE109]MDR7141493.1 hypothetical protein [Bosea sp. BE168]